MWVEMNEIVAEIRLTKRIHLSVTNVSQLCLEVHCARKQHESFRPMSVLLLQRFFKFAMSENVGCYGEQLEIVIL